jgi:hypothetical protein
MMRRSSLQRLQVFLEVLQGFVGDASTLAELYADECVALDQLVNPRSAKAEIALDVVDRS